MVQLESKFKINILWSKIWGTLQRKPINKIVSSASLSSSNVSREILPFGNFSPLSIFRKSPYIIKLRGKVRRLIDFGNIAIFDKGFDCFRDSCLPNI